MISLNGKLKIHSSYSQPTILTKANCNGALFSDSLLLKYTMIYPKLSFELERIISLWRIKMLTDYIWVRHLKCQVRNERWTSFFDLEMQKQLEINFHRSVFFDNYKINDKVPKVGFHKSVALSIITIFDFTSWIFLSLENFAYSKNVKKCPGAKRQKAPSSSSICWFSRRSRARQHTIWARSDQLILEKEQTES